MQEKTVTMGPFVQILIYNSAPTRQKVSVWGYLVS